MTIRTPSPRHALLGLALSLAALGSAQANEAQNWPQKPIRIVVPNPAGGTADMLPRLIAEPLAKRLGQPVVVENKPGAAGNIAAGMIARADPDGYTLMAAPPPPLSINISLYSKLAYDPADFVPVTVMAAVPNVLMVHPDVPARTVQEFMNHVRANPDKLSYASQGSGSTAHLTAELFKMKTGLRMVHVPYKGDAPAITDLLAGHVQLMFGNIAAATRHAKAGKVRILAVTGPKRLPALPDVPTMNEIVPGVVAVAWFAIVAPPGTPSAIAEKVSSLAGEILRSPEVAQRLADISAEPVGNTPAEMARWMKEDTERWRAVIKAGNIRAD